jgi:hypothetical protein
VAASEVILAMALFIGAGAFALGASKQALATLDRNRRTLAALDLARSKLAELEAGLISLEELRTGDVDEVGTVSLQDENEADSTGPLSQWTFDIKTQRSEFRGLTLVQLTVSERTDSGDVAPVNESPISVSLRQLMPLRDPDAADYEVDDLIEGLPQENEDRSDGRDGEPAEPEDDDGLGDLMRGM